MSCSTSSQSLAIQNIFVSVEGREVVRNFSLTVNPGEIHVLMGPNGSGKSSIAYSLFGHPAYKITSGSVSFGGEDIIGLTPEERARRGLFLSFQEPPEVGGVGLNAFLRVIASKEAGAETDGAKVALAALGLEDSFLSRFLNEGFSGGEKKKSEMLQLLARKPKMAILDEIDTGLDVDALSGMVGLLRRAADERAGMLLISHAFPLFEKLRPDFVHVLLGGSIAASGGTEILSIVQDRGYGVFDAKL